MDDREHMKLVCPNICPGSNIMKEKKTYGKAGNLRGRQDSFASPYVPGYIVPWEPTVYPPGAPPSYMPQPTDSTSGDILNYGPIGPWAPGHVDWSPHAGSTGVRPVVDKYSITRYCTGDWRKNNARILAGVITAKGDQVNKQGRKEIAQAHANMNAKKDQSNAMLSKRLKDLKYWKDRVEATVNAIIKETETLEADRVRLKGASRILMLPEAISRECLEIRTTRLEPDLVRDIAEMELIKEVAIVGEIRRVFNENLIKVNVQLAEDRAAKAATEGDWSDKMASFLIDKRNLSLDEKSSVTLFHMGVNRWPENATTLEYWEHYCNESIRNCEEVINKSKKLREDLMMYIVKGSQDMKTQVERTNAALAETIEATEGCCAHLERSLKDNLQKIADIENYTAYLRDSLLDLDQKKKTTMSRLHSRNYDRPNVENCRDEAQYALMDEFKTCKDTEYSFKYKLREADAVRAELMQFRGQLEKEIACKRKSLNVDKDRCARMRAWMPSPEEFASAGHD